MDYDIIIYAVIAIIVLGRLWSVLGQRGGEDHERPNPFAAPPSIAPNASDANIPPGLPKAEIPLLLQPTQVAPASLAGGLAQIKQADASFDEKQFLQGARAAFTQILADFAKGDLTESLRLLGPTVLPHFRAAIEARRAAGHSMEHALVAIREAECVTAKMDGNTAIITVRFVSEQKRVLRDSSGDVVEGAEDKTDELSDLWTFARDTKSTDPNWILVETKS